MSTKKARKEKGKITSDVLSKIDELRHFDGMTASKIADYLNLSESTISRYMRILWAVEYEVDFNVAGDLCWGAITNYCKMNDKRVPKNLHYEKEDSEPAMQEMDPEQIPMWPVMDKVRVLCVANMLYELSGTIEEMKKKVYDLALYLDNSTKEE